MHKLHRDGLISTLRGVHESESDPAVDAAFPDLGEYSAWTWSP